jgi:hypothetical protein
MHPARTALRFTVYTRCICVHLICTCIPRRRIVLHARKVKEKRI